MRVSSPLLTLRLSPGPKRSLDGIQPQQTMVMMTWSRKTIRISILLTTINPWQDPLTLRRSLLLLTIPFRLYGPCNKSPYRRTTLRFHLTRRLHSIMYFLSSRSHPRVTGITILPSPTSTRVLSSSRLSSISNSNRKSPCLRMGMPPRRIPIQLSYTNQPLRSRVEAPFPTSRRRRMPSIKSSCSSIRSLQLC